jgi:hypothetical protein
VTRVRSLVVALWLGAALAQPSAERWTVQTVALRDFREAQSTVAELRFLGFPAYTEFAMHEGNQYVRVRVGCWSTRDAADAVADALRGLVTREAAVVPVSPGAPVECVDVEVGFLKPSVYGALHGDGEAPTYRVEVGGQVAFIRHDGSGWSLLQGADPPEPQAVPPHGASFRAGGVEGFALVLRLHDGTASLFCPGRLVAQVADVAVVEWANAIVACRPAGRAP